MALKERPNDPAVQMLAGDIAMAVGNADRAVTEYARVVEGTSKSSLAKAKLAEANLMANNIGAARANVEALTFDVPLAFTAAIGFTLSQGEYQSAYAKLEEGLGQFPEDPRLVAIDAERLFALAKPKEAQQRLKPVLALSPAIPQAHRLAGQMALSRRDLGSASEHFDTVLKARPNDQTAMLAMAAIARDQGDETLAANWINKANEAGDPHPIGLLFAAQMAFEAGDIDRAYQLVENVPKGIASEPNFERLRVFVDAARCLYGSAILLLQSYLDVASEDYLARRVLAQAYAKEGEAENAWKTIAPALDDPQIDRIGLSLALDLAQKTGRGDVPAIQARLNNRESAPKFDQQMREAAAAIRGGDWAKAESVYAPLVDGAGGKDPIVLNNAASVKSQLGDHAQAVRLARRALAEAPGSPQILDTLGWALWQEGKKLAEARELLTQARKAAPGNREIAEHWEIAHKDA